MNCISLGTHNYTDYRAAANKKAKEVATFSTRTRKVQRPQHSATYLNKITVKKVMSVALICNSLILNLQFFVVAEWWREKGFW
jgi:hypothetical protein